MVPRIIAASLLLLGLLAGGSAFAAWPTNPSAGVPLCRATDTQQFAGAVSDGAGGMIVFWEDERGTDIDIYAQRIDANGNPLWTADGVAVISFTGDQTSPVAIADGSHGVIVAWADARSAVYDIYAARLDQNGTRTWTSTVCNSTNNQRYPAIVSDGSGGAYIAWQDYRNSNWDIYAQRINSSGTRQWRSNGAPACSLAASQTSPRLARYPSGGFYVTWTDYRPGAYSDVYAQRVLADGSPSWTANGIAVIEADYNQTAVSITPDEDYGAYVTWLSGGDLHAQRFYSNGSKHWAAEGVAVVTDPGSAVYLEVAANGTDGLFLAWSDYRNGTDYDLYAQYLNSSGQACWTANGRSVCTFAGNQTINAIHPDGSGGLLLVWDDRRKGSDQADTYVQRLNGSGTPQWTSGGALAAGGPTYQFGACAVPDGSGGVLIAYKNDADDWEGDIHAQHVERFGHLGDPAPRLTRVADVPNDQGGRVQVEWTASYLDTFPTYEVERYSVWRQVPEPSLAAGAREGRVLRTSVEGARAVYWEPVATVSARGLPGYSLVTATTSDSMAGSNPYTSFMVMAETSSGTPFWASAADSGYSTDDLAPPMPAPFTGTYSAGTTYLQWAQSPAPDFAEFRLHRGLTPDFVPGAGNLVAAQASCGYVDPAGDPFYYRLCAVDLHGKASPYAFLQPGGTTGIAGPALPRELALSAPAPNPLRGACALRLALPREARVALAVLDAQGRRVRTLAAGVMPAGEHPLTWDGRDDAGRRVADGVYLVRLACEGRTLTRRVVAIQ